MIRLSLATNKAYFLSNKSYLWHMCALKCYHSFPVAEKSQRTVYTSKIVFKGSLVPEDVVNSSYARARNPELSKLGTLRNKILIPDEC